MCTGKFFFSSSGTTFELEFSKARHGNVRRKGRVFSHVQILRSIKTIKRMSNRKEKKEGGKKIVVFLRTHTQRHPD